MIFRIASNVCFVVSLILFGTAIAAYFWVPDEPGAVVDDPDRNLSAMVVGEHEIRFRLHNPTRHTVRVVGAGSC